MKEMNHVKIAQRFARAHDSYTEHAIVQKKICQNLLKYVHQLNVPKQQSKILEIGCGTGNLTQLIWKHFSCDQYILNDLYGGVKANFIVNAPSQIEWMIGDIEQLVFPQQLQCIVSSSVLQWMSHLDLILKKSHSALLPKGYFIFSTFGTENLKEIKQLTGQGLTYLTPKALEKHCIDAGFEVLFLQDEILKLGFDHPREVLQHLKSTGVTATSQQFRWTKSSLAEFYKNYQQYKLENQQYSLTYHPIYCIARSI